MAQKETSFVTSETKLEELELREKEDIVLEHDIECPRCHGSMSLCSDFDSLYYTCEECDFTLYTLKK
jgi:tRNA(Ile2) C34 agmatinyltransferase TiaS